MMNRLMQYIINYQIFLHSSSRSLPLLVFGGSGLFYKVISMMRGSDKECTFQTEKLNTIMSFYTSRQFLTHNSLFNNLFSSEQFSLAPSDKEFMRLFFGKTAVEENELFEFTYFHKRDKKLLLYFFIMYFLQSSPKTELIIFENGDRINTSELREFMGNEQLGGSQELIREMEKRIVFFKADTHQVYKLNLQFLSFYVAERQFLKAIILSDINEFESGDKSSLERIYKKIPKSLFVLSFKKEIYDYKFIQKTSVNFLENDEGAQRYELHEKVTRNINKTIEGFKSQYGYVVPIEQIGISSKTLDETFRSVIIRKGDAEQNQLHEYIFTGWPFELKAYRKIE